MPGAVQRGSALLPPGQFGQFNRGSSPLHFNRPRYRRLEMQTSPPPCELAELAGAAGPYLRRPSPAKKAAQAPATRLSHRHATPARSALA